MATKKVSYKTSGVDIHKANVFVSGIQKSVASTMINGVIKRSGSFGALFELDIAKYKNPVMVSSTDGVGTKLLLAKAAGKHDTVGIDLVAMNVNDILCCGAKPLFFLDYIACGRIDLKVLNDVVKGIAEGCRQANCALIGGETAEMPGMYKKDDYDLAGFTVGVVEKDRILDGSTIQAGDTLIGLASSGLHSNGFSLARKALSLSDQRKYARVLLAPTKIYVREILALLEQFEVRGLAHMTGGAFFEKLTRIIPDGLCAQVDKKSWTPPEIFQLIQKKGKVDEAEMYRTFNMGIGMTAVCRSQDARSVQTFLTEQKILNFVIGKVIAGKAGKLQLK